jgi:hypothetical protein
MYRIGILVGIGLALGACSKAPERKAAPASDPQVAPATTPGSGGALFLTPGLWETRAVLNGETAAGSSRACVDLAAQKSHDMLEQIAPANTGCGSSERRPVAGGFDYTTTCRQQGATTTVVGQVRGDARHVRIDSTVTSHVDGVAIPPARFRVDSRWLGPCPSGMKPGDVIDDVGARGE